MTSTATIIETDTIDETDIPDGYEFVPDDRIISKNTYWVEQDGKKFRALALTYIDASGQRQEHYAPLGPFFPVRH